MKITIIGAGNVGGALALGWAKAGHQVILGVRNLDDSEIKALVAANKNISAKSVTDAAKEAEVILVSVPVAAIKDVAKALGEVKSKIIIDATNSVFQKPEPYAHGVEAFKALTKCEDVVKCFNSTGFENMANPQYGGEAATMFFAGDHAGAKRIAAQLARDLGFDPVDAGTLANARLLEPLAMLWIYLAVAQKQGSGIAFKLLRR
jgi:predicted dinucleotide-binding enzyme